MKSVIFAVATSLALLACSKGGGDNNKIVALKNELCACKDKACATAVNKKLDDAMDQLQKELKGKEPDADTAGTVMGAMLEAGECLSKLK